jgi:hypothetical protein
MLPTYRANFADVACTTENVGQAWARLWALNLSEFPAHFTKRLRVGIQLRVTDHLSADFVVVVVVVVESLPFAI